MSLPRVPLVRKLCQFESQSVFSFSKCRVHDLLTVVWVFCLTNAMYGQNINLPVCVCVCVCVSVTLSVNSPTGQTPQRIFTVDSLKDADLRKDVPFGGLDDE